MDSLFLSDKAAGLPDQPGVYLMKDREGGIIYVGKALALRKRVASYFQNGRRRDPRVSALISRIEDFEVVLTDSEVEALMLECNLIKKHRPYYNVLLMDDKHYPYLKMTMAEDYPRLLIARRVQRDGARYFGPYADVRAVRDALKLVRRLFGIRSCTAPLDGNSSRPCLNHQMKLCSGPCSGRVSREEYVDICRRTELFLNGRGQELLDDLVRKMHVESDALRFEHAGRIRNQIRAVTAVMERQKIIDPSLEDYDIVAVAGQDAVSAVQLFAVRAGKLTGQRIFGITRGDASDAEVVSAFIKQHYADNPGEVRLILVSALPGERQLLERWLSAQCGKRVVIRHPLRGDKRDLVDMARRNAAYKLQAGMLSGECSAGIQGKRLGDAFTELMSMIGCDTLPVSRVEAYDISNLAGSDPVGAMAVMQDGALARGEYRRFKIKGDFASDQDDYGMMAEVLRRRFGPEAAGCSRYPDLIIIDGGRGQLNRASAVLQELGLNGGIRVISIAKENEEIYLPERAFPISLPRDSNSLHAVQQLRDEVHRTAVTYHRRLRSRRLRRSMLDEIKGLGPVRKKALLSSIGSVAGIAAMEPADLAARAGIPLSLAERIVGHLDRRLNGEGEKALSNTG